MNEREDWAILYAHADGSGMAFDWFDSRMKMDTTVTRLIDDGTATMIHIYKHQCVAMKGEPLHGPMASEKAQ